MFTSKHYQVLADIIRDTWIDAMTKVDSDDTLEPLSDIDRSMIMEGVVLVAARLADNLAIDNPEFDRIRFFHACRLPGLT